MRYNLEDITFLLLVKIDTIERLENLLVSTEFILSNFTTKIEVLEISSYNNGIVKKLLNKRVKYSFLEDDDPILFRTKYRNYMLSSVKTPFAAVWDLDVLLEVEQIIEAIRLLRSGEAEYVLPYKEKMLDTSMILRKIFLKKKQFNFLRNNIDKMEEMFPPEPVGGVFFCKLEAFIKIGLENENFYGWGAEDGERFLRWKYSEFKTERVSGVLFHLSHPRGINSILHNQDQVYLKLRIFEESVRKAILLNLKY